MLDPTLPDARRHADDPAAHCAAVGWAHRHAPAGTWCCLCLDCATGEGLACRCAQCWPNHYLNRYDEHHTPGGYCKHSGCYTADVPNPESHVGRAYDCPADAEAEPEPVTVVDLPLPEPEPATRSPSEPDVVEMVRAIADAVGHRHAYTPARGWYHRADGGLWTHDPEGLAVRAETFEMVEDVARKRMRSTTGRIATELEPLLAYSGGWDADPALCGLPDGRVLDLSTGAKRPARRDDRITRRLGVVPDGDCPRPAWEMVLDHVTGGDPGAHRWLRRWAGSSLVGDTRAHRFLFLVGPGGGGKSTLVEAVRQVAGEYAVGVPEDLFADGPSRHREAIARLDGARMLIVADLPGGTTWARLGLLKALTAGDTLTANHMRRNSFDFRPVGSLWVCGNAKPRLPRADTGLSRRLVLMPVAKLRTEPDPSLPDRLQEELAGIASWAVEGAGEYLQDGLGPVPPRWSAAATDYLAAEDTIAAWFDATCTLDADAFTASADLVTSYNQHTGAKYRRATALLEWLADHHGDTTTPARQRMDGEANPTRGVLGVRVTA